MSNERLIKKYANRRLYDASQSRHVTLEDIREFVIRGEKVRVVEDKSGEDITRLILLQVIAEQEQFGQPILSTTLLESIIRFYGNGMQEFMARYLEKSVETFTRQQEAMQTQMTQLMANAPMSTMTELARQNLALWQKMQEGMAGAFLGAGFRAPESAAAPASPAPQASGAREAAAAAPEATSGPPAAGAGGRPRRNGSAEPGPAATGSRLGSHGARGETPEEPATGERGPGSTQH